MKIRVPRGCCALIAIAAVWPAAAQSDSSADEIRNMIATYATAVDRADTGLVDQLFSNGPEVTFIHPLGEARGRDEIETVVFKNLMGAAFSKRKLVLNDIAVHVYGDTAWSEYGWDFYATVRKDGSPFHSAGRETQIYHRENGHWKIVHVHYSGAPVSGKLPNP